VASARGAERERERERKRRFARDVARRSLSPSISHDKRSANVATSDMYRSCLPEKKSLP